MASGARTSTLPTYLNCEVCNNTVPIFRKRHKMKEKGHVKHMWCFKCKDTTAHIEVKEEAFYPAWLREMNNEEEHAQ